MNFIIQKKEEYDSLVTSISKLEQLILNMNSTCDPTWLSETKAMQFLDVSKSTIQRYRKNGLLPFSQYANKIMYKNTDLNMFLESNYSVVNYSSL